MSKRIPVTLKPQNPDAPELKETQPGVSLGEGYCEMPFVYKGKEFTDSCYITPKGEQWCATEVDSKTRQLKKFAYCDVKGKGKLSKKTQKKEKVKPVVKSPPKKPKPKKLKKLLIIKLKNPRQKNRKKRKERDKKENILKIK